MNPSPNNSVNTIRSASGRDYPLDFFLQPMKPSKPSKSLGAKQRLQQALQSNEYIAEEKIDGCHYFSIGGRIFSPRLSDTDGIPVEKTEQVKHISEAVSNYGTNLILDGEIWYPEWKSQDVIQITGSLPDEALRKQDRWGTWLRYMVFDILRDPQGNWLTNLPWIERRKILEQWYETLSLEQRQFVQIPQVVEDNKLGYLNELLSQGKEGIVLKHIRKPYVLGKRPAWNWVKCKVERQDDVVIMGFEPPEREYTGKYPESWTYWAKQTYHANIEEPKQQLLRVANDELIIYGSYPGEGWEPVSKYYALGWVGSIVFGKYDERGNLIRLGTCSGMDEPTRERFTKEPQKYIGRVIKVKLMEFTRDQAYRHCSFVSLHEDKNPRECKLKM